MNKFLLFGIIAIIALILITIILVLIGIVFFLLIDDSSDSLNSSGNNAIGINSGTGNTVGPIPSTNDLWATITLPFVEKSCLSAAKQQAGDLAIAVTNCSCTETKTLSEKNYSCIVSAFDGDHNLDIDCVNDRGSCNITSEQGLFVFTFEELYNLVS